MLSDARESNTRTTGRSKSGLWLLLLLMLFGVASPALAGEFCVQNPSFFGVDDTGDGINDFGIVDGEDPATVQFINDNNVTQITIDGDCTFRNWTASNPLTVTLNFQTSDPSIYLITFDNVVFTGNMACASIDHRIWFVNGDPADFNSSCQDLFIPVESINKAVPAGKTTVGIGEVFTYTLKVPVLYDPANDVVISDSGSLNELHSIVVTDDINEIGANLTLVGAPTVVWAAGSSQSGSVSHNFTNSAGLLTFEILPTGIAQVSIGDQFEIKITLSVDDTNVIGTQFFNTARWVFGRLIELDPNDDNGDGDLELTFFDPLPGENGVSELLTIGAPDLTVTKSSPDTALNIGIQGTFFIDVQNTGNTDAWDFTIIDEIPGAADNPALPLVAGMCQFDPSATVTAQIFEADGTTAVSPVLTAGADYSISFNNAIPLPCELTLVFDSSGPNAAVLAPGERLIISYQSELDSAPPMDQDGALLTNVAGATQWYSSDPNGTPIATVTNETLTDGTPGDTTDHESSYTITAGLSGYFFTKSVQNITTGANPASTAAAGDTLRYQLRVFNIDQTISSINIVDNDLIAANFDTGSFSIVSSNAVSENYDPGTGTLTIDGGSVSALNFLLVEYDINLAAGLTNGAVVSNQASMTATGTISPTTLSDDPNINGVDDPTTLPNPDPTVITILQPGPLLKTGGPATATIGNEITYRITVPEVPLATPLYDVRMLDNLTTSSADLEFVSATVVSGGSWTLTNTGTSNNLVIEDTGAGIDIPTSGQAVIDVTVRVSNTVNNQIGDSFNNTATYTYNRTNNLLASQTLGSGDTTPVTTVITEPDISTITKIADNTTPTAGSTIRYSVTLTATSGANISDVFDVTLSDSLDLGLAYAGSPTVTIGSGVGSDNIITDPDVTGDGITIPQSLVWSTVEADIDIDAGETIIIAYDVLVLNNVLANQSLSNSVIAQWTGIDGVNTFERTGIDGVGGVLNDYAVAPVVETVTTADIVTTINKIRSSDTFVAGDDNVRIGDVIDYTLTIPVPEGTLGNLQLVDTLSQGLDFLGVVSINGNIGPAPYSAIAPFTHTDIAAPVEAGDPATGPSTVTWNIGNLSNAVNDGLSDNFVIVYQAQVLNNDVLVQVNSTALSNGITMTYDTATGTVISTDNDTVINVLQPNVAVNKSATPANGDVFIDTGEVITYSVDLVNTGAAPAYDLVLEDIIPVGLRAAVPTTTSITRHTTSTDALVATLAVLAPTYSVATGLATWNFDTGVADTYTIPVGETLRIVYTVTADAGIAQGLILTNAATATLYYSFDDEAIPAGAASTDREIYGPSNTASTTLFTSAPPSKTLITPAEATIGEEVVYQVTVPGVASSSALFDVSITDTLDTNLEITSVTVAGVAGAVDASTASQMNIAIPTIPAGQQATIELRTRLLNVLSAQQGVDINNTVSYSYAFTPGGTVQPTLASTDIVTVNIVEPNISAISKTVDIPAPTSGETIRYSVQLAASGGVDSSDVFDVTLTDNLDLGLIYVGNPTVTGALNTIGVPVITGNGITIAQTLVWSSAAVDTNIDIVEGTPITIDYDVRLDNSVLAGQILNNSAVAQWTGIDGANGFERDGSDGIGGLNDYITVPATVALNLPGINTTISKLRSSDTFGAADDDVRIGDIVEYTLTIPMPEGSISNLQLVDTLPQGLDFEGIVSINGNIGPAPYTAVAPFSHGNIDATDVVESGDPALGATTITWTIGTLSNLPVDNLANDFVIVYRARVMNLVFAHSLLSFSLNNIVTMSYDTASGTIITSDLGTVITAGQPLLTVSKTAAPAGGDTIIDASELIEYTIEVVNGGTAPAYDLLLQDIIPLGMRNGAATVTMVSTELLVAGALANPPLVYNAATGLILWDLDTGVADTYTIPPGDTLRLVYRVQADADLGPGQTMTNAATANLYYSFDDDAVPTLGSVSGIREIYGPSNTATTTLTTAAPAALLKETTQTTAFIGEQFTYRITVPATPQTTSLEDVRILDDLSTSLADLSFVSVTKISGSEPWTPVNTSGDSTNLVIEDTSIGIDIPAGDQAVIEITVVVNDSVDNFAGLVFNNTADYTYTVAQTPGLPGTSGDMTIIGADTLVLQKTGPVTMRIGLPETFTIDIQNTATATAWDITIEDVLPDPSPGGMCDTAPTILSAQVFEADGVTAVSGLLSEGSDFTSSFIGVPVCSLTIVMQSPSTAIAPTQKLIITYEAFINNDSIGGTSLTNIAAATQWFSDDTAGGGATGEIRTYTGILSTGTVGTDDEQDAHTLITESPVLLFYKSVINTTTGQDPGVDAAPGDTLQYTIHLENISAINLPNFSLIDDLDALNSPALFESGSLNILSALPSGAIDNSDVNGGIQGTGLIDISNLSLDIQGGANDTIDIVFEVTLVPVIDSGTVILNQVNLDTFGVIIANSDDPNVNGVDDPNVAGDEDPTETLIASAPIMQVLKTSTDVSGDPNILLAGDTLRYTITIKNIGTENSINTILSDQIPANTTYVPNSTTLNGVTALDPSADESALETGMLINAPENTTPGFMRADTDPGANNVATITFDVVISPTLFDGAVISNQGFVSGDGVGSGVFPVQPSDDPDTSLVDDPTLDVVGNSPLIDVLKTVAIVGDIGTIGVVDPGEQLRYTITITNIGSIPATGVVLTDAIPADTSYVADSAFLNTLPVAQPDGGISPLIAGIDISSSDLTPPLPTAGNGVISPGESAIVIFDVLVDGTVVVGTVISNQGFVSSNELPIEPSDFDGIDSNGDQPTDVIVGSVQQLAITKEVLLVDGVATPGSQLEYLIRVTNIGGIDATNVVVTDNLDLPVAGQMTYVADSGRLNGLSTGVSFAAPILTGNYSAVYGALPPGEVAELRFRVVLDLALIEGTTITNIGEVTWTSGSDSASVDIDVGGILGSAGLNGLAWQDTDFDNIVDAGENLLTGWTVQLYQNNVLISTTLTDTSGAFGFIGLGPNTALGSFGYELRYITPGAIATSATTGNANSVFTDGPQRITDILAASGASLQNLNLPRQPNGIVYDSVLRTPVAGVRLSMINQTRSNQLVPATCFDDPNHQNQVTIADGYYKFDLNFSDPARCGVGDEYEIQIQPPTTGFLGTTSLIIPPVNPVTGAAEDVPVCPATAQDRVPTTTQHCENSSSPLQSDTSIAPRTTGTDYYLKFIFDNAPATDQIYNNHIPVDSQLIGAVSLTKLAGMSSVTRSQLVPYTIALSSAVGIPLFDLNIVDNFPAGFKYVSGSSRVDGVATEPLVNGLQLTWTDMDLDANETRVIDLLLVVGSGVGEGEYINTARGVNSITGGDASGIASATVIVVPDPTFDCTDIIGKVFDDKNLNGNQDDEELGLAGVQVATARGLRVTTDFAGRFHLTCALIANEIRGSNFIMKVDDRTLPSGYRITTENPRVQRATRGKMMKFNFGATIHRVVRLDLADGVFEPDSVELRPQWVSRLDMLIEELEKAPSVLRLSYLAENETESEVEGRLDSMSDLLSDRWRTLNCCYKLTIEKEVFWRKGHPSDQLRFD